MYNYLTPLDLVSCLFDSLIPMIFIMCYFNGRLKFDLRFWIFSFILFSGNISISIFDYMPYVLIIYILPFVLTFSVLMVYSLTSFKSNKLFDKAVLPFIYTVPHITSNILSSIIIGLCYKIDILSCMFPEGRHKTEFIIISKLILCTLVSLLLFILKRTHNSKHSKKLYLFILPLPLVSAIVVSVWPIVSSYLYDSDNSYIIYYISTVLINLISTFAIYYMIYEMHRKSEIEKEKELYQSMLVMEEKRYDDIKHLSEQILKIKHDMKNMLLSVKSDVAENNAESANTKLKCMLDDIGSVGTIVNTGNRTFDYIVNAKLAKLDGTSVVVNADLCSLNQMDDMELSIVLGNLLDNAVEGTKGVQEAIIELSVFIKDNYRNIVLKNTICESVLKGNPQLNTNKQEHNEHGFGIKSVREIVTKHEGTLVFFEESNKFCAHIMIPIQ